MSKSAKRKRLPREFLDARELITAPVISAVARADLVLPIFPMIPDTHTAQFNKEIYNSLVLAWEASPPAGEEYIDVNDIFKLIVKVSNVYEVQTGPYRLYSLVPKVWFKDVWLRVTSTQYATVQNPSPWGMYPVAVGNQRLKPRDTVVKEFNLKALGQVSGVVDPSERVVDIRLFARLDYEKFFAYTKYASAYTQIRPP